MMEQSSNFNVNGFLQTLQRNQPQAKGDAMNARKIEKVSLSFNGNYGKYQILPVNSTITGFPFRELKNTREIMFPMKNRLVDGTEREFSSWVKILPPEAYLMVDSTGRVVSSLTREEEELLAQARNTFDQLFELLGGRNKETDANKTIGLLRKRDYTVFHGKCLGKWGLTDPRTPERQNFPALFICSAKGFMQAVSDNVNDETLANGGNADWLGQIYNRQQTGRTGFLIFSISLNQGGKIGYSISINHKAGIMNPEINNHQITDEEIAMMTDPVETFLGFQAGKERLFNKYLMQDVINYMSLQIQNIQMAISTGADVVKAWEATSALTLKNSNPVGGAAQTNDPFLASQASQVQAASEVVNPGAVVMNNTDPFSTPPAAHIDPITQQPVNTMGNFGGSAPFEQPSFAKPAFAEANPAANNNPFGGFGGGQMNDPFRQ